MPELLQPRTTADYGDALALFRRLSSQTVASSFLVQSRDAFGGQVYNRSNSTIANLSTPFGASAIASGNRSTALGAYAYAKEDSSVAVGVYAQAGGFSSIAIGDQTRATAYRAIGIGTIASASGVESIAIGVKALASGLRSVSLGHLTQATAEDAVAIGELSEATAVGSVAIGAFAIASGAQSIAIGEVATASAQDEISIGWSSGSAGNGTEGVFIGGASFGTAKCVAVGHMSDARDESVAVGWTAEAAINAVAIGYLADANGGVGEGSIAIGREADASGAQCVFGSTNYKIEHVYFGKGVDSAAPTTVNLNGTSGTGVNVAGSTIRINPGLSTGNADGGSLIVRTSPPGSSGTSINGFVERVAVDAKGNVVLNASGFALQTTSTDGFTYIPTCAGTPTGVPTTKAGTVALIFDTTNNRFYIYDGGWISVLLA